MPLPSTSPILLSVAVPAGSAAPATPSGGHSTPFARMLSEQRAAAQDDADAAPHESATRNASRAQAARRASSRDGAPRNAKASGDVRDTAEAIVGEAHKPEAAGKHGDGVATDPALAGWIAALHPGAAAPAEPLSDKASPLDKEAHPAATDALGVDGAAARRPLSGADPRADKSAQRDVGQRAGLALAADEAAHGEARATASDEAASHASRFELPKLHDSSPATGPTHAEQRAQPGAAPVVVDVATPVASPEFREALGVHVSVLARDGVQRAELHLNPADMGPISVQIALDGNRAQVDFGAASAATRHAIEAGLPELAAALRDAGYTLAGGGVSQHAGGQSPPRDGGGSSDGGGARAAQRADAVDDATPPRRLSVRLPQGAVDLYA